MNIQVDETISFSVYFDPADREEGWPDDIRFAISDSAPKHTRLFKANEIGILLTPDQAERLAFALRKAAQASRDMPRL